jgi:SAM-dependent methyltransferase
MPWFSFRRQRSITVDKQPSSPFFFALRRRHRADTPYILPTDLDEINRLDFQHYMVRAIMRGLYWSPIRQPTSILDVGTGTGRWAREMAQYYQTASIIGFDLKGSPANVSNQSTPYNLKFEQGNLLEGLPFPDRSFDLVHQRFLISGIPQEKWPDAIAELARVTTVGGWVELTEAGLSQNNGPALRQLDTWVGDMLARRNLDIRLGSRLDTFLRQAGLQHISMHAVPIPIGPYGGRVGTLAENDYFGAILAMRDLIATLGLTTLQTYDSMVAEARREVQYGQVSWSIYVAYGQRVRSRQSF